MSFLLDVCDLRDEIKRDLAAAERLIALIRRESDFPAPSAPSATIPSRSPPEATTGIPPVPSSAAPAGSGLETDHHSGPAMLTSNTPRPEQTADAHSTKAA